MAKARHSLQKWDWACLPGALGRILSPLYPGTAASPRLTRVAASIYRDTEMRQSPLAEAAERSGCRREMRRVPTEPGTGGHGDTHGDIQGHTDTHRHTEGQGQARCVRAARRGKSSPQQPGHPPAAGFFQPEHPAACAVIYGKRFLTRGFFYYDRDPRTGGRQSCSQGRRSEGEEEAGAEGQRRSGEDRGRNRHQTLQRWVSYN